MNRERRYLDDNLDGHNVGLAFAIFCGTIFLPFAYAPDFFANGQRFLFVEPAVSFPSARMNVVLNWTAGLK
jgi:hypothetical protein